MKELSKDVDQVIEGPIVAVQYPSVAPFTVNESTATELSVKYSHLKNLDVDDKKAYKELVSAIKDVSSNRIQINKEEDAVKKPLNAFRKLVLDTGKALRAAFEPLENSLKAEKDRIDTVLADREAAKRKVWQDNLDELKSLYVRIDHNMNHSELNHLFGTIDKDDSLESDFGDLLEEAKTLKESIFERIKASIKYKKEQAEFEAKRIAFEKEQAEAAERERIANEEREAMAKRIAELEAASKPESVEIGSRGSSKTLSVTNEILSESGASVRVDIDGGIVGIDMPSSPDEPEDNYQSEVSYYGLNDSPSANHTPLKSIDYSEIEKDVVIDPSLVDMASGPDESVSAVVKNDENGSIEAVYDGEILYQFILALKRANNMRVITITKEKYDAVERVKSTLVKAIDYLEQFENDGEN